MADERKPVDPSRLVKTQAEPVPPPARDVPGPGTPEVGEGELIDDIRSLAERAGGLERLRELIDSLIRMPR